MMILPLPCDHHGIQTSNGFLPGRLQCNV